MSGWRQARAIALLPGNVNVTIPVLILVLVEGPTVGWGLGGAAGVAVAALGLVLMFVGFAVWLWTVVLFQRIGRGTLAAWDPTSRLVVAGPYRYVRNPMISAVATFLLGEAIFLGSPWIGIWAAIFIAVNFAYFVLVEEPGLERRFGPEYLVYKRNTARWIPNLHNRHEG